MRKIWAPTLSRRAGPTEIKKTCPSCFLAATDPETPPVPQSSFSQLAQCYEDANSMPISLSPKQIGLSSSRSCLPSQSLAPIWWHLKETGLGQGTRRTSAARERLAMALENIGASPWGFQLPAFCHSTFIIDYEDGIDASSCIATNFWSIGWMWHHLPQCVK